MGDSGLTGCCSLRSMVSILLLAHGYIPKSHQQLQCIWNFALRYSWKGITFTCLEDKPFHFDEVQRTTVDFCTKLGSRNACV